MVIFFFLFPLGDVSLSPGSWECLACLEVRTVGFMCWHLLPSLKYLPCVTWSRALCPSSRALFICLPFSFRRCSRVCCSPGLLPPASEGEGLLGWISSTAVQEESCNNSHVPSRSCLVVLILVFDLFCLIYTDKSRHFNVHNVSQV